MQAGRVVTWTGGSPTVQTAPLPPTAPARPRWPTRRLAAVEALWGAGFTGPGGGAEIMQISKPLELNSNASVLLLGAGLGGPAETIVQGFGAWVAGFEADQELATRAEQRRQAHPYGRRMQVATWDNANPGFGNHNAHHAITLEAMRGGSPEKMLNSLAAALRPRGQAVLTELVAEGSTPADDAEFAAWCRLEDRSPNLPQLDQVTTSLAALGFDVQVVEDLSDRHVSATLAGWHAAVKTLAAGPKPSVSEAAAFVTEAELWLLRIRMMRRFGVRLVRWHAVGAA